MATTIWAHQPDSPSTARRTRTFGATIVTRRVLQYTLGALWLLDGALQLQSYMFTKGFANQIIAPAAAGQPALCRWSRALECPSDCSASCPLQWLLRCGPADFGGGLLHPAVLPMGHRGLGGLGRRRLVPRRRPGWCGRWAYDGIARSPGCRPALSRPGRGRMAGWRCATESFQYTAAQPGPVRAWAMLWIGFAILDLLPGNEQVLDS